MRTIPCSSSISRDEPRCLENRHLSRIEAKSVDNTWSGAVGENEGVQSGFCRRFVGEVTLGFNDSFSVKIR